MEVGDRTEARICACAWGQRTQAVWGNRSKQDPTAPAIFEQLRDKTELLLGSHFWEKVGQDKQRKLSTHSIKHCSKLQRQKKTLNSMAKGVEWKRNLLSWGIKEGKSRNAACLIHRILKDSMMEHRTPANVEVRSQICKVRDPQKSNSPFLVGKLKGSLPLGEGWCGELPLSASVMGGIKQRNHSLQRILNCNHTPLGGGADISQGPKTRQRSHPLR